MKASFNGTVLKFCKNLSTKTKHIRTAALHQFLQPKLTWADIYILIHQMVLLARYTFKNYNQKVFGIYFFFFRFVPFFFFLFFFECGHPKPLNSRQSTALWEM